MNTITISASKTYEVLVGSGLLDQTGELTARVVKPCKAAIITDSTVDILYTERTRRSLEQAGFETLLFVFPAGESSKNLTVFGQALNFLAENRLSRSDLIVALGGGVVGDLAGFVAAVYLRGIRFIQIPTTLLAAVDSSVGGKTAVDLDTGKNLAGAFWQPELVICDPDTLTTLPERTFREGCAEVLKYGLLIGEKFLRSLEETPVSDQLEAVICTCIAYKRDIVAGDEFDRGQRQLLNLGHTIGHAVETKADYRLFHGECVAIGMAAVIRAAVQTGHCSAALRDRVLALIRTYGLPTETEFTADELYAVCCSDKKIASGTIRLVVPAAPGGCRLLPMPISDLREWLEKGLAV